MFEKDVAEDIRDSFNNEAQILSHEVLLWESKLKTAKNPTYKTAKI